MLLRWSLGIKVRQASRIGFRGPGQPALDAVALL
jgi:hypothetical protein